MSKPRIFAHCPAGCEWETVHRDEFEHAAAFIPHPNAYYGEYGDVYRELYELKIGKTYRIANPQPKSSGDGKYAFIDLVFVDSIGATYIKQSVFKVEVEDTYADHIDVRFLEIEPIKNTDSDYYRLRAYIEVNGQRTYIESGGGAIGFTQTQIESNPVFYPVVFDYSRSTATSGTTYEVYLYNENARLTAERVFVRYSANADGSDFTEDWTAGQSYIGVATGREAPTDKSGYKWSLVSGTTEGAVVYEPQELTEEQKAQARANIGAMAEDGEYSALDVEVQNGYYDCQANSTTFIEHGSYSSAKVACAEGEKYRVSTYLYRAANHPVAWLYTASDTLISTVGGLTGAGDDNGEQISGFVFCIPANCAYFITTHYNAGVFVIEKWGIEAKTNVLYTPQELTEEQKAQARANIGAMAERGNYLAQNIEVLSGLYDSAVRYENENYKCTRVECIAGEKYRVSTSHMASSTWPVAWLYDANSKLVATAEGGTITDVGGAKRITECEFITPENCAFFEINCISYQGHHIVVEKYEIAEFATLQYVNSKLTTRETAFRELRPEIKNGYYDCTPTGENFYSHDNYRSARVTCAEGEKYRIDTFIYTATNWPVAWLYSNAGTLISTVGGLTGAGDDFGEQIVDFEFDIPANCAYFITTQYAAPDKLFRIKRYVQGAKPLAGKNAIYLGDSITYIGNGWRTEFNAITGANEVMCKAVSGAHLCDYEDTIVDGIDYFTGSKNTLSNQVQDIINSPPTERIDFIIIAAGTNDHASLAEFEGGVTQFAENDAYIDVDTVDRTRYDGAMRWIAEKLWGLFPDAVIFFATPIQAAEAMRGTWVQMLKSDYIQEIAGYLGTPTIDATRKSGIYGRYENANANGKYLYDGLHPNLEGRIKLGRYYASEVVNYFSYLKD